MVSKEILTRDNFTYLFVGPKTQGHFPRLDVNSNLDVVESECEVNTAVIPRTVKTV